MLKKLLFAVGGAVLGVLLAHSCGAEPRVALAPIKPALAIVRTSCVSLSVMPALLPVLSDARRLMVKNGWEYGGVLYRNTQGRVCVSDPATSERYGSILHLFGVPEGWELIGLYHTHPGLEPWASEFSATDALSACLQKVSSFIVSENGLVMRLDSHPLLCEHDIVGNKVGRIVGMVKL